MSDVDRHHHPGHRVEPADPGPAAGKDGQEFWDEFYRGRTIVWSGRVNPVLAEESAGLAPGSALDLGCGEGADAIWLAQHGWHVTAIDVSAVALERAAAHARAAGVTGRITWVRADLSRWTPHEHYDLVSAQYLHSPEPAGYGMLRAAAGAVAINGTLLAVGHNPDDVPPGSGPTGLWTPDELAENLALPPERWRIDIAETRPRSAGDPAGRPGRHAAAPPAEDSSAGLSGPESGAVNPHGSGHPRDSILRAQRLH